MTDVCICNVIETCPEFSKDDGSDGYVDNAMAVQLLITMRAPNVYKLSESLELPYEMAGRLRLQRIQHTLMPHMIYATRTTYLCCLLHHHRLGWATDPLNPLNPLNPPTMPPESNAVRLLERVSEVEMGLGALVISFIRPLTVRSSN